MGLANLSMRVRLLLLLLVVFGCGVVFVFAEDQNGGATNHATVVANTTAEIAGPSGSTQNDATANQNQSMTAAPIPAAAGRASPSQTPATTEAKSNSPASGSVRLNFPAEVELKVIVDYVSQRLGMKILYDEEIANKKVSLRAPGEVPVESLLGVLQSALKMKGLALVDGEVPGWKRIVGGAKLASVAPAATANHLPNDRDAATAVTQTFVLKYADTQKVDQAIKTFLTPNGANSIAIKDPNVLIVTDYTSNLARIAKLVELLDQPRSEVVTEFVPIQNLEAAGMVQQITALIAAKAKSQGDNSGGSGGVEIAADARTNQVVLVGPRARIDEALSLIRAFDVPLGLQTKSYACRYVKPERIDRLAKQLIQTADAKRLYQSAVDAEGGLLVVTTTPEIHAQLASLRTGLDIPAATSQSPMRFYKLKNTTAEKVLETLRAMAGESGDGATRKSGGTAAGGMANNSMPAGSVQLPLPPGQTQPAAPPAVGVADNGRDNLAANLTTGKAPQGVNLAGAKVVADANTNSLIVWAEPATQRVYEELIHSLDRRRPQVLIEAKVITIDTSDNFALGVELSKGASIGPAQLLSFSSFGLSTVSAATGALSLTPGTGFNGAIVDSNIANLVVQAVESNSRAKVLSSPRVLVNDNTKGELASVLSVSYSSVNASQTVATTSVGGSQDAGTTITVTPHISEGDHLQLDFALEFSSFTSNASSTAAVPPPRQVDKVQSTVTIPDGYTVIVGGLNRNGDSQTFSGVPILDRIPVAKYLFSYRSTSATCSTLFVFIRSTILRDDKFQDIKFLSDRDAGQAGEPGQYPNSEPLLMR